MRLSSLFSFRLSLFGILALCLVMLLGNSADAGFFKNRRQARQSSCSSCETKTTTTQSYRGVSRGCQDCQGGCSSSQVLPPLVPGQPSFRSPQVAPTGGPKVIVVPFSGGTLVCPDGKCPKKK